MKIIEYYYELNFDLPGIHDQVNPDIFLLPELFPIMSFPAIQNFSQGTARIPNDNETGFLVGYIIEDSMGHAIPDDFWGDTF